jgi:hypothetical protein
VPPGSVLRADHFGVQLDPVAVTSDVGRFQAALRAAKEAAGVERVRRLAEAVELYGGELLPGFYEEWVFPEQRRLHELYRQALQHLVRHYQEQGNTDPALEYALRLVQADGTCEEAHAQMLRLYAAAGRVDAALAHAQFLERVLAQNGLTPSSGTRTLIEDLRRGRLTPEPRRTVVASNGKNGSPGAVSGAATLVSASGARVDGAGGYQRAEDRAGGALPLDSPYYMEREADRELARALARGASLVLLRGPRQVGKTSLLARGLQGAREAGRRVACTDLQLLPESAFQSAETVLLALRASLADQLGWEEGRLPPWHPDLAPGLNFQRFLSALLEGGPPLLWGIDELDRLLPAPAATEVLSLFRSLHNARALEPQRAWAALTVVMAYATEPRLYVVDPNLSPWNVGVKVSLEDFTPAEVADLNERYGNPLGSAAVRERFYRQVGGHPHLVRLGLQELALRHIAWGKLEADADREDGPFADPLRRLWEVLRRDPELCAVVRGVLAGKPCPSRESFYRLRTAGVLAGTSAGEPRLRCGLYATFLGRHLAPEPQEAREGRR